ncbi:MAG: 5-deoxy-glucuronate isomerase [Verrucomicrobia bacterium]|nr:5-deoxy-glucuronate isomerase [Verrucomicrobiota bacterium]
MRSPNQSPLLVRPTTTTGEFVSITPASAGWNTLHFGARRLAQNETWESNTADREFGFVILDGICSIESSLGQWSGVGRRPSVFEGLPHALYLPRNTAFKVTATSPKLTIAYGSCASDADHPAKLVTPNDVAIEIRGGGNATRQINSIFPPGFPCHRIVAVEVYTPAGNWSSYPPHKHDVHTVDDKGTLIEADLEETYFFQIDPPQGYAIQRVYTTDGKLDETVTAKTDDVVLVPEGYHPVGAAHGYNAYYLNFLAGSAQSLANTDDPDHAWVKNSWTSQDPRIPMVTLDRERVAKS